MSISNRIYNTIEDWQAEWKDRLKGWLTGVLSFGLELFFDVLGKAAAPKLKPLIDTLEATEKVPPELQPILEELKSPQGEIGAFFAQSAGGAFIGGAINLMLDQLFADPARALADKLRKTWLDLATVMQGWNRGVITNDELTDFLRYSGYPNEQHEIIKNLAKARLDPITVMRLWL